VRSAGPLPGAAQAGGEGAGQAELAELGSRAAIHLATLVGAQIWAASDPIWNRADRRAEQR